MEAKFVFYVDAPTSEIALKITSRTLSDFNRAHPGIISKPRDESAQWLTQDSVLAVPVIAVCDTPERALSINGQIKELFAKHQRAEGISVVKMGSLAVASGSEPARDSQPPLRAAIDPLWLVLSLAKVRGVIVGEMRGEMRSTGLKALSSLEQTRSNVVVMALHLGHPDEQIRTLAQRFLAGLEPQPDRRGDVDTDEVFVTLIAGILTERSDSGQRYELLRQACDALRQMVSPDIRDLPEDWVRIGAAEQLCGIVEDFAGQPHAERAMAVVNLLLSESLPLHVHEALRQGVELVRARVQERQAKEERRRAEEEHRANEERSRLADEQRRHEVLRIQSDRVKAGLCAMCGNRLGFAQRIIRARQHGECQSFRD